MDDSFRRVLVNRLALPGIISRRREKAELGMEGLDSSSLEDRSKSCSSSSEWILSFSISILINLLFIILFVYWVVYYRIE